MKKIDVYPATKDGFFIAIKECGNLRVVRLFSSMPSKEFLDADSALMGSQNVESVVLENVALDYFDELETN